MATINRIMKVLLLLLTALVIGCAGGAAMYSYKLGGVEHRIKQMESSRAEADSRQQKQAVESTRILRQKPELDIEPEPVKGVVEERRKGNTTKSTEVNTISGQLFKANMAFGLPQKANIQDDIKAQLVVDVEKAAESLVRRLEPGTVQDSGQIRVSRIVKANLVAPDFKVDPVTPEEQPVAESGSTEWMWNLRPLTPGLHPVKLSVWAEVKVGPKSIPYNIHTYERQVVIEVTAAQIAGSWWSKYWQWTFTTLIIPLGIWFWKKRTAKAESTSTNRQ